MLLLRRGHIIDPSQTLDDYLDILIRGSEITEIGKNLKAQNAQVFDASGLIVAPGYIEMHDHLREPGKE